jgi:hypothetical protein
MRIALAAAAFALCIGARAQTPPQAGSSHQDGSSHMDSITVEAARHRDAIERQIKTFVSRVASKPYDAPLARWQSVVPICPLVAGLSKADGEYVLTRVSQIAAASGAPLGKERCKPNFYIVVSADPDALLKAWTKRDVWMFGDEADQGGSKIRKFLNASSPVRVWYNAELYSDEGVPLHNSEGGGTALRDVRTDSRARATRMVFSETRDLTSALVMVDGPRAAGVNFKQLASFIAMVGLAEIRADADGTDAPSILRLFSSAEADRPPGLSQWDEAFLKALYRTAATDKQQLAEIKSEMVQDIAPE